MATATKPFLVHGSRVELSGVKVAALQLEAAVIVTAIIPLPDGSILWAGSQTIARARVTEDPDQLLAAVEALRAESADALSMVALDE